MSSKADWLRQMRERAAGWDDVARGVVRGVAGTRPEKAAVVSGASSVVSAASSVASGAAPHEPPEKRKVADPEQGVGVQIMLRLSRATVAKIDAARAREDGVPNRQTWIRQLIEEKLK